MQNNNAKPVKANAKSNQSTKPSQKPTNPVNSQDISKVKKFLDEKGLNEGQFLVVKGARSTSNPIKQKGLFVVSLGNQNQAPKRSNQTSSSKGSSKVSNTLGSAPLSGSAPSNMKGTSMSPSSRVMSHSEYLRTISDPFNFRGVQIPDLTLYPSTTFSVIDRRSIQVDSNGQAGVMYGTAGYTGATPEGALTPVLLNPNFIDFGVGQYHVSAPTGTSNFLVDVLSRGTTPNFNWTEFAFTQWQSGDFTVPQLFQNARLVSAATTVDYTGTDFDNAGIYTGVFVPRNSIIKENMNNGVASPLSLFQSLPDSIVVPVNKNEGVTVRYRPQDFTSLNYSDLQTTFENSAFSQQPLESLGGEMYVLITGATSAKVFQVTSVFNYEGIPLENTLNLFQTRTSKSDPLELSATFNALEYVVPTSMGTEEAMGESPLLESPSDSNQLEHHKFGATALSKSPGNSSVLSSRAKKSGEIPFLESILEGVGGDSAKGIMRLAKDVTPLLMDVLKFI